MKSLSGLMKKIASTIMKKTNYCYSYESRLGFWSYERKMPIHARVAQIWNIKVLKHLFRLKMSFKKFCTFADIPYLKKSFKMALKRFLKGFKMKWLQNELFYILNNCLNVVSFKCWFRYLEKVSTFIFNHSYSVLLHIFSLSFCLFVSLFILPPYPYFFLNVFFLFLRMVY